MPDSLFTLIAQIVNFLVIVIVLRLLLFKKIVHAIDERQKSVSEKHKEAEHHEAEANENRRKLEQKNSEFHKERERVRKDARSNADNRRKELENEARNDVERQRKNWMSELEREQNQFIREIKSSALRELLDISRRIIADLTDGNLQRQMTLKLRSIIRDDNQLKEKLVGSGSITVRSSFPLQDDARNELRELFGEVDFVHTEDFHGIQISADGRRLEWTIESWLDEYENHLKQSLDELMDKAG